MESSLPRWHVMTVHDGYIDVGAEVLRIEGGALVFYTDEKPVYGVGPGFWKDVKEESR